MLSTVSVLWLVAHKLKSVFVTPDVILTADKATESQDVGWTRVKTTTHTLYLKKPMEDGKRGLLFVYIMT